MVLKMMARAFDRTKFNDHTECSICLEEFKSDDRVTPLPCNTRHYFHSKCIEEWSQKQKFCPLCNAPFTLAQLTEYDKRYSMLRDSEREEMMRGTRETGELPNINT